MKGSFPNLLPNLIGGEACTAADGGTFSNQSPHDGRVLCQVARSGRDDIMRAVAAARAAQAAWEATPPVQRGAVLHRICNLMEEHAEEIAAIVADEAGKPPADARGETGGAIACGRFYAGEGQRLYGRTCTSGTPNKYASTIRQACGVAALIVPANTPVANVAWKLFPALICGNAVVMKSAEDTPATAWIVAEIAKRAGLPDGLFNVVHGFGEEAGKPLVEEATVDVISFTGSTAVGRWICETAGRRLIKVSCELGGKNALVVCDDADLENAAKWASLSAFSNAGQRCAAGSRILVFDAVYDCFVEKLVAKAESLKIGVSDGCDLGPVISKKQTDGILASLEQAKANGARVLCGGGRATDADLADGHYVLPTLIEGLPMDHPFSRKEHFGPVASLFRVKDYAEALRLTNDSPYGLTACIHTRNFNRAVHFTRQVQTGVAVVNMGTFGSEPHMPFGGVKQSGNGSREPGTEALDIYSNLKDVYIAVDQDDL